MTVTQSAQIRFRVTEATKNALGRRAEELGFKKISDFYRAVLTESHLVVIGHNESVVLLTAPDVTEEERQRVTALMAELIAGLNRGAADREPALEGDGAVSAASPAPVPDQRPTERLQELGDAALATSQEEDGLVGPGSVPPAEAESALAPPAPAQPVAAAAPPPVGAAAAPGETPPGSPAPPLPIEQMQQCSRCGNFFPAPVQLHHSWEDCDVRLAAQSQSAAINAPDPPPVPRAPTPSELEPDPNPPLGPPRPGETEIVFMARRLPELRGMGRAVTIARAEAGAEWRQAIGEPLPPPPQIPMPAPPQPVPAAPAGFPCPKCGTTRLDPTKPCLDCGARPEGFQ